MGMSRGSGAAAGGQYVMESVKGILDVLCCGLDSLAFVSDGASTRLVRRVWLQDRGGSLAMPVHARRRGTRGSGA